MEEEELSEMSRLLNSTDMSNASWLAASSALYTTIQWPLCTITYLPGHSAVSFGRWRCIPDNFVDVVAEGETITAQKDGHDCQQHQGDATIPNRVPVRFEKSRITQLTEKHKSSKLTKPWRIPPCACS